MVVGGGEGDRGVVGFVWVLEVAPSCQLYFSFRRRKQDHKLRWKAWLREGLVWGK